MDLNDLEEVTFRVWLAGANRVTVGDVSGTDLTGVTTDLRGTDGQPDGGVDEVRVQGTNGDDVVQVVRSGAQQTVFVLITRVSVAGAETGLVGSWSTGWAARTWSRPARYPPRCPSWLRAARTTTC